MSEYGSPYEQEWVYNRKPFKSVEFQTCQTDPLLECLPANQQITLTGSHISL